MRPVGPAIGVADELSMVIALAGVDDRSAGIEAAVPSQLFAGRIEIVALMTADEAVRAVRSSGELNPKGPAV
jgi:hypothetical protein